MRFWSASNIILLQVESILVAALVHSVQVSCVLDDTRLRLKGELCLSAFTFIGPTAY